MHDFAESEVFQECIYVVAETSVLRSSDRWLCWRIPSWLPEFHTNQATFWSLLASQVPAGEGDGTPPQYSCLENPMDGEAWWAAVHGVAKSWTWLSDFLFTFHFHALKKEMATHSSVLAWRIPGTGEPGGLPSMGSHRVGHDWSDLAAAAGSTCYRETVHCQFAFLSLFKNWSLGLCINPFELVAEPWLKKWKRLVSVCS